MKKEIPIPAIKDGTVIDHIPSRVTFKVLRILDPQEYEHTLNVGINLASTKEGKKGLIKIHHRELNQDEVNKVALLAPHATVSIIKNYEVEKKMQVVLPKILHNTLVCTNPRCITNNDPVTTKFTIISQDPLHVRCYFCERSVKQGGIKIKD